MRNVILVAPHATANTLRYVEALCALPGVRAAVLSCDPLERFPASVRGRLAAHERVPTCVDGQVLAAGARAIAARIGAVDRLFGVLEQVQMAVAEARDRAGVPGMGAEVVRRFRDKSAMKEALRAADVPCARHARVTCEADARAFVGTVGWPVILKPVDGLGTRSTWRIDNDAELDRALAALRPSPSRPAQCEEFLTGSEHSFETVTIDGRHVWSSSTDYLPGPLEVMQTPWIQYCVVLPRETTSLDRFRAVNHAALDALGMQTGLSHMEWFARADGSVAVNEVGARPPGVNIMPLMSLAHGVDFVAAWVRLMALDVFDAPRLRRVAGNRPRRGGGQRRRSSGDKENGFHENLMVGARSLPATTMKDEAAVKQQKRFEEAPVAEIAPLTSDALVSELRTLIEQTRARVAQTVNSELVWLYWQIGHRLRTEVLDEDRAAYGKQIVEGVASSLSAGFGRGFDKSSLYRMMRFAEVFPDREIVAALRPQLSWTHLRELITIDDPLRRQFYTELCRLERWSTRTLKDKMNGMLFERTAIARQPDAVIAQTLEALGEEGKMTPDLVFRDPCVLDFLRLPRDFAESDLEAAILQELEAFLLELGTGFSFVARQKRMSIGPDDYYVDLLFFHRPLRALVAIELKLGRFDARDKGQMELYLRWLDRHERQPHENPPLGLILCADKNEEQVELLELDQGSVRVASYLTELPPRELLERKLLESIDRARTAQSITRHGSSPHSNEEAPQTPPRPVTGVRTLTP